MKILTSFLVMILASGLSIAQNKSDKPQKSPDGVQKVTYLGVYAEKLSPVVSRQLGLDGNLYLSVEEISPGSPAEKAGVAKYDILKKLDDQVLVNNEQLRDLVRSRKPNEEVDLLLLRSGKEMTIKAKLSQMEVPKSRAGAWKAPRPGNDLQGGIQIFPHGGSGGFAIPHDNLGDLGERIRRQMEQARRRMDKLGLGRGQGLNAPDLLQEYDLDGNGKLSQDERDQALRDGVVPNLNLDLELDFGLGAPNVDDLLRDARRRGASSSWSSVTGSASAKVVTSDDDGTFEFSSTDGNKRFKATDPDGKVVFDGPVDSKEQREAMPEHLRNRLETLESGVNVRIRQGGGNKLFPKPKRRLDPKIDDRLL